MRHGSNLLGTLAAIPAAFGLTCLLLAPCPADSEAGEERRPEAPPARAAEAEQRSALQRRSRSLHAPRNAGTQRPVRVIHTRATWYGPGFHGKRTASGERFDRHAMTLASRHLPFGTRVRVVNLRNGKSVIARVNDRGPFGRKGYTVDLSQAVARKIGLRGSGPVRLEILPRQ